MSTARIGLALMVMLAMILLAIRNDRFRFAELVEHDDQLAALDLLHFAREQFADALGELVADARALAFADPLDDALLGGLHRGATELGEVDGDLHHVAELELRDPRSAPLRAALRGPESVTSSTTVFRRTIGSRPCPRRSRFRPAPLAPCFLARAA